MQKEAERLPEKGRACKRSGRPVRLETATKQKEVPMEDTRSIEPINEEEIACRAEEDEVDRQIEEIMSGQGEAGGKKKKKRSLSLMKRLNGIRGWSRRRKILAVILLGAAAFFLTRCGQGGNSAVFHATVATLQKSAIQETLTVSGPVEGTDSVDVVSNIHAEITQMNVKEGDQVTKGQILAVLDKADLEREVEIAQNSYELAVANQAEQNKSQALGYEKAVQDCQAAQADYDRKSLLFANGDISQVEMETAANALADARRHMAEYNVVDGVGRADPSYELQVKAAQFTLDKAKEELENTEIKSSIDGTVVRVNSKVGQFADRVEDDKPILSIENLEQLEMEIKISEYSIGKVKLGQKVKISADILEGETVDGEVVKISPTGEEKGGGSTERVIPTTIRIEDSSSGLIAGITAKAQILIEEAADAFVVPVTALIEDGEGTYIAVVSDGKVKRIPVVTGVDGDIRIQVTAQEGFELTEGMQVIVNANTQLADGMDVLVTSQE